MKKRYSVGDKVFYTKDFRELKEVEIIYAKHLEDKSVYLFKIVEAIEEECFYEESLEFVKTGKVDYFDYYEHYVDHHDDGLSFYRHLFESEEEYRRYFQEVVDEVKANEFGGDKWMIALVEAFIEQHKGLPFHIEAMRQTVCERFVANKETMDEVIEQMAMAVKYNPLEEAEEH